MEAEPAEATAGTFSEPAADPAARPVALAWRVRAEAAPVVISESPAGEGSRNEVAPAAATHWNASEELPDPAAEAVAGASGIEVAELLMDPRAAAKAEPF